MPRKNRSDMEGSLTKEEEGDRMTLINISKEELEHHLCIKFTLAITLDRHNF
jgi:hypothetical protein